MSPTQPHPRILILAALVGWLCLALPATAAPPTTTEVPAVVEALRKKYAVADVPGNPSTVDGLPGLVQMQRIGWPHAEVTSGFYDWRTVSRYRRNAGLHLGYDIAMPYGTPVRAAWDGTVVSVAPWTGSEWGITVSSPSGVEVTYGHLAPSVRVGEGVRAGDVVGTIASDHVDVKMRDAAGNYVDFGARGSVPNSPFAGLAATSREAQMVSWLVARNNVDLAEDELQSRKRERAMGDVEVRQLRKRVAELEATVPLMAGYVEEGLVARVEAEKVRADLATTRKKLAELQARLKTPVSLEGLQRQLTAARQRLAATERQSRQRGIAWAEVDAFVNGLVASNPRLKTQVESFKKTHTRSTRDRAAELKREVTEGARNLAELEDLFEMGGLPRREIEAAREKQKIREAELRALTRG